MHANDQLLVIVKYLLLKIQSVEIQCATLQALLHSHGISSPERFDTLIQQQSNSPEFETQRGEILNLGPADEAIAQIAQALESLEK